MTPKFSWRPLEHSPFYHILCRALEKYVGKAPAAMLASAYALGDPVRLRDLFKSTGFQRIEIRVVIKQMQCPSLTDFFYGGLSASPFAKDVFALETSELEAMLDMIREGVAGYLDDSGLAAPMEAYVVSALK